MRLRLDYNEQSCKFIFDSERMFFEKLYNVLSKNRFTSFTVPNIAKLLKDVISSSTLIRFHNFALETGYLL